LAFLNSFTYNHDTIDKNRALSKYKKTSFKGILMLGQVRQRNPAAKIDPAIVERLYLAVTSLARNPVFYTRFQVPDTVDGRFDLLTVMLSLYLFRIQQNHPELAQGLFDRTFKDVERGLREAGVGDLSVPKHMKRMLAGFYGRAASYYEALEQQQAEGMSVMLTRNLYNGDVKAPAIQMGEWVRIAWNYLQQLDTNDFINEPDSLSQLVPADQE
jgi:cytochrome b pre-mRNA-processing protein 3